MSHDIAARRVFGVTLETITRRILATFDRATASDVESGARWYDDAHDLAVELSAHCDSIDHAAAVIAALSPRTTWSRNVAGAVELIVRGAVMPGLIGRNVATARRALVDGRHALSGPKTRRFAANIAGNREAVTVDVWAARAAGLDEDLLSRKGAYDAVEHAYRLAARRRGVDPATMQATTWIVARNGRAS
jgi:hypothetical protein